MRKVYTIPAVTADGQDTNIGVVIDDAKLLEWLSRVRARVYMFIGNFKFPWSMNPRSNEFHFTGAFAAIHSQDGIYIEERLFYEEYYRDTLYTLEEFCRMIAKGTRPSLGWCITVTVQ